MNKKKIIATFLLSANLFGSAYINNAYANTTYNICKQNGNSLKISSKISNDQPLTFLSLVNIVIENGIFRLDELNLQKLSKIDENFFKLYTELLSISTNTDYYELFIKRHPEFKQFTEESNELSRLKTYELKISLSDPVANEIKNNYKKYGVELGDIDRSTITLNTNSIIKRRNRSENESYYPWKKTGFDKTLLLEYENTCCDKMIDFANYFLEKYKSKLESKLEKYNSNKKLPTSELKNDNSHKNLPTPEAICAELNKLLKENPVYTDGTVTYNRKISNNMKLNVRKKSRNRKYKNSEDHKKPKKIEEQKLPNLRRKKVL